MRCPLCKAQILKSKDRYVCLNLDCEFILNCSDLEQFLKNLETKKAQKTLNYYGVSNPLGGK